jgi:hypothetical protein
MLTSAAVSTHRPSRDNSRVRVLAKGRGDDEDELSLRRPGTLGRKGLFYSAKLLVLMGASHTEWQLDGGTPPVRLPAVGRARRERWKREERNSRLGYLCAANEGIAESAVALPCRSRLLLLSSTSSSTWYLVHT